MQSLSLLFVVDTLVCFCVSVLKPALGSGSDGVVLVRSLAELQAQYGHMVLPPLQVRPVRLCPALCFSRTYACNSARSGAPHCSSSRHSLAPGLTPHQHEASSATGRKWLH